MMPESGTPRRRRRPAQPIVQETENLQQEPRKIVISMNDEPDWMISASHVSGAAERRGASPARPAAQERKSEADSGYAQQSRAILEMQKKSGTETNLWSSLLQRSSRSEKPR